MQQTVSYRNYRIKVYSEGKGEPLVFLHGWPTNSRLWSDSIDYFKSRFRIITFDWLGFGKSDKPETHQYTFQAKTEILQAVTSQHIPDKEPINIIAHDIGGPPAILWASKNQKKVKRLILLNTIIYPFSTPLDKVSHFFFQIPLLKSILVSRAGLKILMHTLSKSGSRELRIKTKKILDWHENFNSQIKLKTILSPLMTAKKNEFQILSKKFAELDCTKFLIIAKSDPLCYQHIKKLSEENPQTPAFIIENCGHYIPIDQPRRLNEVLHQILET